MIRPIFVFGSNEAGRHGRGAALFARENYGAVYGEGIGITGHAYAIPTKDKFIRTLPLEKIKLYVDDFLKFARENRHLPFFVTRIGCGLAGYKDWQIAPMFKGYPENCIIMPEEWKPYI